MTGPARPVPGWSTAAGRTGLAPPRAVADAPLPPPNKLLTWGRLLVAARLLEDGARSADGVAQALSVPSGSAFRNTSQRYLAATPGEMRTRGGGKWVLERLLDDGGEAAGAAAAG